MHWIPSTNAPWGLLLAQLGQRLLETRSFVETGTHLGWTASHATLFFPDVTSIELLPEVSRRAREVWCHAPVKWLVGHSPEVLRDQVLPGLVGPAVFWLDAHCDDSNLLVSGQRECPLLEELEAVYRHRRDHFVLIDDARLFLAPHLSSSRPEQWPSCRDLLRCLAPHDDPPLFFSCLHDVIVICEERLGPAVREFWRAHPNPYRCTV